MKKVEQRLTEYRAKKYDRSHATSPASNSSTVGKIEENVTSSVVSVLSILFGWCRFALYPFRLWELFYNRFPVLCLSISGIIWIMMQSFFVYCHFGSIFFLLTLFCLIFINLGQRRQGEFSAYSVFNPGCERLPGTLTAEHFERDLLLRNRKP